MRLLASSIVALECTFTFVVYVCVFCHRSLGSALSVVAAEMESLAEAHKQLASSFSDDLVKPLKTLSDSQSKARKPVRNVQNGQEHYNLVILCLAFTDYFS